MADRLQVRMAILVAEPFKVQLSGDDQGVRFCCQPVVKVLRARFKNKLVAFPLSLFHPPMPGSHKYGVSNSLTGPCISQDCILPSNSKPTQNLILSICADYSYLGVSLTQVFSFCLQILRKHPGAQIGRFTSLSGFFFSVLNTFITGYERDSESSSLFGEEQRAHQVSISGNTFELRSYMESLSLILPGRLAGATLRHRL